jgi:hypothetical protein
MLASQMSICGTLPSFINSLPGTPHAFSAWWAIAMAITVKIVLGLVVLALLTVPLAWVFGRSVVYGYLFGLVMMTAYFVYLLLIAAND